MPRPLSSTATPTTMVSAVIKGRARHSTGEDHRDEFHAAEVTRSPGVRVSGEAVYSSSGNINDAANFSARRRSCRSAYG
jgi:hypothetical protein